MNILRTFLPALAVLLVTACAKELELQEKTTNEGRETMVTLSLRTVQEEAGTPETRAVNPDDIEEGTADTYKVKDFWLLQYNQNGEQIGSARYYEMEELEERSLLPVILPTQDGVKYQCVIIANTHSEGFITTLAEATTLDKLKALVRSIHRQEDLSNEIAGGNRDLLMNGVTEVTNQTQELSCNLYRNVAKLTLRLTNKKGSKVKITSVQLRNVPDRIYYAEQLYNSDVAPSPTTKESKFIDMILEDCKVSEDETKELIYYLPRNRRGERGATRPEDKNKNVPEYATFVEIMAEDTERQTPLRYRFYLGANMVTDFNIKSNYHYTLPIIISDKGTASDDSRVEDMGNVSLEPANSYIINPTRGDAQAIYAVPIGRINDFWRNEGKTNSEPIIPGTQWIAEVIWQDQSQRLIHFCDKNGESKDDQYNGQSNSFFYFKPVLGAKGNVLIGVRKADGTEREYLWSWHLWITDYNPTYTGAWQPEEHTYAVANGHVHRYEGSPLWDNDGKYKNKYIMDRNLGALSASSNEYKESCGFYYQFGRKDPFPHSQTKLYNIDGSMEKDFNSDQNECIELAPGVTELTTSVNHPYIFYCPGEASDWMYQNPYRSKPWNNPDWYLKQSESDNEKSLFDPCPPGWRLPENGTWDVFSNSGIPNAQKPFSRGWNFYMIAEAEENSETTWYPTPGSRHFSSGTITEEGRMGYCWSASPQGTYGYHLFIYSGHLGTRNNSHRGHGFSVRCIQE